MENRTHFHTLDELIRALDKERKLLKEMFGNRKTMSTFRYELARDYASRKEESLDFLRRYGVIRDNGDGVELEDVYLKFFEDVLEVNEEINVASVKESIDSLNNSIEFYLIETAPNKKQTHLKDVKRILQNIALNILRSVIDLKRNIDSTYKNEPTLAVKKKKLEILDAKRNDISLFITECEKVIDERQATFFHLAMDVQLKGIVTDVKYQLHEAYHNLIELERQIINYLNLIEYQDRLIKKVQKLKYLKDQMILDTSTDIRARIGLMSPVWMEPRPKITLKVSLPMLRNTDDGLMLLQKIALGKGNQRLKKGNLSEPFSEQELLPDTQFLPFVDSADIKNAFLASGDNLFHFLQNYSNYRKEMSDEDILVLFCQIASQYLDELDISGELRTYKDIEFPMIYSRNLSESHAAY